MTTLPSLRKTGLINLSVEEAFSRYTEGMGTWWPLDTHSVSGSATSAVVEAGVGGRVVETAADGSEHLWGEVRVWEPPHRLVYGFMYWRGAPGTEVELRFTAEGEGTRVDLEHRHWDAAAEVRAGYDPGWDYVFGRFIYLVERRQHR